MDDHEHFMRLAIEVARQNRKAPFGTIIVDRDSERVVAQGINQTRLNPLLHGEMDAIDNYAETKLNRWQSLRLYTTAEPCCMCQSAILWAGIPEVIFGTSIARLTQFGWRQFELTAEQVVTHAKFAACQITGGVLAEECDGLFRAVKEL